MYVCNSFFFFFFSPFSVLIHERPPTRQTAAQPLESLLLPADFIASVGGNNKGDDGDHLESARDRRSEEDYEAVLPDGWEKGINGKYVDVTAMKEQEERPMQSTGWTPWRF